MGGGGVQTPPPSRWWKIQRPSRARVNIVPTGLLDTSLTRISLILWGDIYGNKTELGMNR